MLCRHCFTPLELFCTFSLSTVSASFLFPPFLSSLHPLPALLLFPSISYHMSRISRLDSLYSAGSASHHLRHRHSRADKKSQLAGPVRHCPPPAILGSCWRPPAPAGARTCSGFWNRQGKGKKDAYVTAAVRDCPSHRAASSVDPAHR